MIVLGARSSGMTNLATPLSSTVNPSVMWLYRDSSSKSLVVSERTTISLSGVNPDSRNLLLPDFSCFMFTKCQGLMCWKDLATIDLPLPPAFHSVVRS